MKIELTDIVLRSKAIIVTDQIEKGLFKAMIGLMHVNKGIGLAAPQIGLPLRIFILSKRVFKRENEDAPDHRAHYVYINPKIIKRSRRKERMDEGCLSVRGKYGTIARSTNVTVEAYDEFGIKFTRGAGGLLAQAFQHETDHLEGTLFIDHAEELWDVAPRKSDTPEEHAV
jgi:peptide deformylase